MGDLGHSSSSSSALGEMQVRDYLDLIRRRRWWIILAATAVFVTSQVVVWQMPSFYHSETVILVDPQQVPANYVAPTVSSGVADRLSTIRQETLSPTRLRLLREHLNLPSEGKAGSNEEEVIQKMQKSINIDVVESGSQRRSAFKIGYTCGNAKESAQVANELADMIIQENLKTRAEQFSGTANFLDSELRDTRKQLEQKEADLERIKTQNIMDLPESKQFHLEALTNLRIQLRTSEDRVNRAQQEKIYLQSVLNGQNPAVDVDSDSGSGDSGNQTQIQKLQTRLADLRARYGPNFPDIRKAERELADLQAKAAAEQKAAPAAEAPKIPRHKVKNPVLEAQIAQLDQEIADQKKVQPQLEEQISFHSSKLERVPIFEQQISSLMRDYDTLRHYYDGLLEKKLSADMASELEDKQQGERFVILDPAQVPSHPAGPNRLLFGLAGLLGGLFGGIALAFLAELSDDSVRTEREAAQILGKAVLAGIPTILSTGQILRKKFLTAGALLGTVVGSVGFGFLISYLSGRLL